MKVIVSLTSVVAALVIVGCGNSQPNPSKPGTPTEVMGVSEKASDQVRVISTPSATLSGGRARVTNTVFDIYLPLRFKTSNGVSTTKLVRFTGIPQGVKSDLTSPNTKKVRFEGVALATEETEVEDELTTLAAQSMKFDFACIGKVSADPKESCFELVMSLFVTDAAKGSSLQSDQGRIYHFTRDFDETLQGYELKLNTQSTQELKAQGITDIATALQSL